MEFERKSAVLKRQEARLAEHLKTTGLLPDNSRVRVDGFGRSVSQKAVHAAKRAASDDYGAVRNFLNRVHNVKNDLKSNISITDLPNGHGAAIQSMIDNSPNKIKKLFSEHSVKVCNTECAGTPHYSGTKKAIRLNIKNIANDPRGDYVTVFHEAGHSIDVALGRPSHNPNFRKLLQSDFDSVVRNTGKRIGSNDIDKIYSAISKELRKTDKTHSISDIIGGITKNKCYGNWKHQDFYWRIDKNRLEKEVFAHFFEATARNDVEKLKIITNAFPNAYNEFLGMLG